MTDSNGWERGDALLPPPPREPTWGQPQAIDLAPIHPTPESRCVGRRVAAGFIDLVPLTLIAFALTERVDNDSIAQYRIEGLRLLALAVISFAYYFVAETLTGTTAGKRLMGLAVVRDDGTVPGPGAIARRTVLRAVDGLPVFYLVGFICVVASPDRQRIGDLLGHTRVVRVQRVAAVAPRPQPRVPAMFALLLGVLAVAGGLVGTISRVTETPPSERLGRFEIDRDMVPVVDRVMSEFAHPTVDGIAALFPSGAVSTADIASMNREMEAKYGTFSGQYSIEDHRKLHDVDIDTLGRLDVMQIKLTATFSTSTQTVIVSLGVVDDRLTLIHWDIAS